MVNFMTCTKLIVGCIKSKVINTLCITNWNVHTQECLSMFKTQTVSFQSEPLRSVWSRSKSRLVFITEISTPKSRFVALHYQDVRSNSELHLEFCRYGIINVWCDEQSMTYVRDCFIILGPNHCWTSTLKSIIPRQKKRKEYWISCK